MSLGSAFVCCLLVLGWQAWRIFDAVTRDRLAYYRGEVAYQAARGIVLTEQIRMLDELEEES